MRFKRTILAALMAATLSTGAVAIATPAAAAPAQCVNAFMNGREVYADNNNNGGGAYVSAIICWSSNGNGYYDTWVTWDVTDTAANGAGATIRMEWTGTDGDVHYDVPPSSQRAWTAWDTASGSWEKNNIKGLYIRACLTNTNSEGHHCGPKW